MIQAWLHEWRTSVTWLRRLLLLFNTPRICFRVWWYYRQQRDFLKHVHKRASVSL